MTVVDGIIFAAVLGVFLLHSSSLHSHPESFLAQAFVYQHLDSINRKKKWFLKGNDKECQFPTGKCIHLWENKSIQLCTILKEITLGHCTHVVHLNYCVVTLFQNLYSSLNASTLNNDRNKPQLLSPHANPFGIHHNEIKTCETYFTLVPVPFPLFYNIKMSVNTAGVHATCSH